MTKTYTTEEKIKIISEVEPPLNKTVVQIAEETGIKTTTLYSWKRRYLKNHSVSKIKERYNKEQRFHFIAESAPLSEHELGEYCRKKGIHPDELVKWKKEFLSPETKSDSLKDDLQAERQKRKELEKQLRRKEKALAEAAALLVLEKKLQAIWDDNEED